MSQYRPTPPTQERRLSWCPHCKTTRGVVVAVTCDGHKSLTYECPDCHRTWLVQDTHQEALTFLNPRAS